MKHWHDEAELFAARRSRADVAEIILDGTVINNFITGLRIKLKTAVVRARAFTREREKESERERERYIYIYRERVARKIMPD